MLISILLSNGVLFCLCSPIDHWSTTMVKDKEGERRWTARRYPGSRNCQQLNTVEDASCPLTSALSGSGQNSEHHPVLSNQDLTFSTDEVIFQSGFEIIQISI